MRACTKQQKIQSKNQLIHQIISLNNPSRYYRKRRGSQGPPGGTHGPSAACATAATDCLNLNTSRNNYRFIYFGFLAKAAY